MQNGFETLRLHANMNQGRRETCVEDYAHDQLVIEPVHANPHGQYDYVYSSNEENPSWLIEDTNKNNKEDRNMLENLPCD
jgi:hypothetical protein